MDEFGFLKSERLRRAFQLRKDGKPQEALLELELACEENNDNGQALYVKADAFAHGGFCLKKNEHDGFSAIDKSTLAGCPWAMAKSYWKWNLQALNLNESFACGVCYLEGRGVEKDLLRARELFLQATKGGNLFAMRYLSCVSTIPEAEQFYWAEKAGLAGDAESQFKTGVSYQYGSGVEQSQEKAIEWFLKAALQRHCESCFNVASYFEERKKDLAKSAHWYLEHNNVKAIRGKLEIAFVENKREMLSGQFVFGKAFTRDDVLRRNVGSKESFNCRRIYRQSVSAAEEAVVCFSLICKSKNLLSKDLRRIVCEMIWDSRADPFVWKVALREDEDPNEEDGGGFTW